MTRPGPPPLPTSCPVSGPFGLTRVSADFAGEFFLGDGTPVASGDYYAGPSHCLPTGTTARFTSGLSVYTFLKRSSVETYPEGLDGRSIEDIAALAEAEGLDAHAHSVRVRGRKNPK